jgi:RNA polymerase sigma-70 factor (ECF subfamily)
LTEKEIIQAAKTNSQGFARIYELLYNELFRFIFKRVSDRDLAADLVSQTFVKALVNITSFKDTGAPIKSWIYRIAVNEVNMHFRNSKKVFVTRVSFDMLASLEEDVDPGIGREEKRRRLLEGLNQLDETSTLLIEMRYFQQMRHKEMGDILGVSEDAAKMKVHRAFKRLKSIILRTDEKI